MEERPVTRLSAKKAAEELQTSIELAEKNFLEKMERDACPVEGDTNVTILGMVGHGSYGTVYKAQHAEHGVIALKKYSRFGEAGAVKERQFLYAMNNIFIVKCLSYYKHENAIHMILPYAAYGTLKRLMHCRDELLVKPFYAQMVCALQYLHAAKITHGDAHPGNWLIFKGGHIKLSDFGVAQVGIAGLNKVIGYAKYTPPEMVLGQPYGSSVDWWCFGVIVFEQLVGTHPYYDDEKDTNEMDRKLREIMNKPLKALQRDLPLSPEAADIIRKTIEVNPAKRAGRDAASIQAMVEHLWFKNITFARLLIETHDIPEFEQFKLTEVELTPAE